MDLNWTETLAYWRDNASERRPQLTFQRGGSPVANYIGFIHMFDIMDII